jgi:hypothetical protein
VLCFEGKTEKTKPGEGVLSVECTLNPSKLSKFWGIKLVSLLKDKSKTCKLLEFPNHEGIENKRI